MCLLAVSAHAWQKGQLVSIISLMDDLFNMKLVLDAYMYSCSMYKFLSLSLNTTVILPHTFSDSFLGQSDFSW